MVRTYKRKTSRGSIDSSLYEKAARDVNEGRWSIRRSASAHNVNFMTLYRYIKRKQVLLSKGLSADNILGYSRHRQIFSDDIEEKLEHFIIESCASLDELTSKEMRSLAYIYARLINIKYPEGWDRNKEASDDWLQSFLSRRPKLAFRKGKRPGSENKYDKEMVAKFLGAFDALFKFHDFDGGRIWAIGETIITPGSPGNQVPSVRLLLAANSLGDTIPPLFIFPLPLFKDHFISQGPSGCIGAASSTSVLTPQIFLQFVQHLYENVESGPVLLILNSSTQLSSPVRDFCKTKGIIILPCPPCSQCLHPLEMTVIPAFKKHYNAACSSWMQANPDSLVTIYDIPIIVTEALPNAMTAKNITGGFQASGIWPFDPRSVDKQWQTSTRALSREKARSVDTLSVIQLTWCNDSLVIKQEPVEDEPCTSCPEIRVKTEEDLM